MFRPTALALFALVPAVAFAAPASKPGKSVIASASQDEAGVHSDPVSRIAFCRSGQCQIAVVCPQGSTVVDGSVALSTAAAEIVTSASLGDNAWYAVATAPRRSWTLQVTAECVPTR